MHSYSLEHPCVGVIHVRVAFLQGRLYYWHTAKIVKTNTSIPIHAILSYERVVEWILCGRRHTLLEEEYRHNAQMYTAWTTVRVQG
jgi:hypothetical protein